MSYCSQCGVENTSVAKFCSACGNRLGGDAGQAENLPPAGEHRTNERTATVRRYDLGVASLVPLILAVVIPILLRPSSAESYAAIKRILFLDWSNFTRDFGLGFRVMFWVLYVGAMFKALQRNTKAIVANAVVATLFFPVAAFAPRSEFVGVVACGVWALLAWAGVWEAYVWKQRQAGQKNHVS
jgi:hypothetical protein